MTASLSAANPRSNDNSLKVLSDRLLIAAIVCFFLEGAMRKWVIPVDSPLRFVAYFSKDIFAAASLAVYHPRFSSDSGRLMSIVLLGAMIAFLGATISAMNQIVWQGAIMTLRSLVVLPVCAAYILDSMTKERIRKVLIATGILVVANAPLASVQFFSPQGAYINKYVTSSSEDVAVAGVSQRVRATGTFSYLSGLCIAGFIGCIAGALLTRQPEGKLQALGKIVFVSGMICSFATVSRAAVFGSLAFAVYWVWTSRNNIANFAVTISLIGGAAGVILYITGYAESLIELTVTTFLRAQSADSFIARLFVPFFDLTTVVEAFPLGNGLGTGQGAGYAVTGIAVVETEYARLVIETGILGLIGYFISYFGTVAFIWSKRKTVARQSRVTVLSCVILCLLLLQYGIVFNHVSSIAFWTSAVIAIATSRGEGVADTFASPRNRAYLANFRSAS